MDGLREFLSMGGYAPYVWGAYGLSAVVLAFNAIVPGLRERRLQRTLAARAGEKRQ
jgi:heme exporter protein D